ncbi:hypothetical protein SAMN05444392_11565 [Seinonella peptonophila]|uniref:Uncharacterized protein n=1 Tax=Seinonella peptonophila TaxID=112248 RepID=A0A1M5ARX2_9BACL|nr:hypothetical protein [Seinonella peptonophila]SHF32916.1 hypothetical protein SAMN05444392_11565 [Seinonella peptonophila]
MRSGDYEISDADLHHAFDQLNQLEIGLDTLSGNLVKDMPQLFEVAGFVTAMDNLSLREPQSTEQSQIDSLQRVTPLMEKIEDIKQKWKAIDFSPAYKDSRPGFYLSNKIGNLASIQTKHQISSLLEVIKGNDPGNQLSKRDQSIVTLAKVAAGDYSLRSSDLDLAKSFFTSQENKSDMTQSVVLADSLFSQMRTQQLVNDTSATPSNEIRDFMEAVMPVVKFNAYLIERKFQDIQDEMESTQQNTSAPQIQLPEGDFHRDAGGPPIGRDQDREL